ncbi:MAG: BspA family leucine-rich repeat surface protein, partial [Lactobacillus sp.]|nr:BspA family leucine-rich repeat surface protein [Lactobacillus sp.]
MSKHINFYHKGKKILFSSMAVAALSVIAANPVAAKAAESQKEQPVKPAETKSTTNNDKDQKTDIEDHTGEDDSNMLLPSKWTKDNCSYDEKTKTLTIKAGTIDNDYKVSEDNPINPAQIAWNIDGVDTDQIQTIKIDGAVTFKGDASSLFAGLPNLEKIEGLKNLDTKEVTNMKQMFASDPKLTSLDLSNLDTSKVTDMMGMFFDDDTLSTLDVSNFKTDLVEDMSYMFSNDSSLTKIDGLKNFNTEKVTKMWEMFKGDKALTSLDISNFKMAKHDENIQDNVSDTNNTDDNKGTAKPSHQTYTIDQDMLS